MVEFISYQKKKYPIKLGYYVLKMLKAETSKNLEDIGGDLEIYETLLFYALKQGAKIEGMEFKFTKEDMEQVLDECFFDFVELIPKFFPDAKKSNPGAVMTIPEPTQKKKSTSTSSVALP